ncbi:MAG: DUF1565 domain-containing protein [Candidatus Zixiibacteriota bacterium]
MNRAVTLLLVALTLVTVFSCGKDSNSTGPTPVRPARTIYVDSASVDSIDGSQAHPYTTITSALGSAIAGDTILVAPGTYGAGETFPLHLKPGNILAGADRSTTVIQGPLLDENTGTSNPVTIRNLHFTSFAFNRNAATGVVTGTNLIKECLIDSNVSIAHGGGHHFDIDLSHIVGELSFTHDAGSSVNRVRSNQIDGGIVFATGDGATDSISNNQFWGGTFVYQSGSTDAHMGGNELHSTGFVDKSGPGSQIIEFNLFEYNGSGVFDSAGVVLKGSSVTFRRNTVHGFYGPALDATSGAPTLIQWNIIQVGNALYCARTKAGAGEIVGNDFIGGPCGLHDESAATLISYNTFYGSDTGLFCASSAIIRGNEVTGCSGPGMVLMGASGPVDSNYVQENGFGVVVTSGSPDLGGGAMGCAGYNYIARNNGYDLVNRSSDSIKAENNIWGYNVEVLIAHFEIYDQADDPSVGPVDFMPLWASAGYHESGLMSRDRQR